MPSVTGAAAAGSDSDHSDDEGAVAPVSDDERDERDRAPGSVAPDVGTAAEAEAALRQKERQLALLQREVVGLKRKLPALLAGEREEAEPEPAGGPLGAALASGALRCVLCQAGIAGQPTPLSPSAGPSPRRDPEGPTQCKKCVKFCCAVYCSAAHQRADQARHAAECEAVMGDSYTRKVVVAAKRSRPPAAVTRFRCGLSDNHDYEVRRTVQGEAAAAAAAAADPSAGDDPLAKYIARVDSSAALTVGRWAVLRGQEPAPPPAAAGAAAAPPPPPTVPAPWVSFGSNSSVVLNWLPAGPRYDPRLAPKAYTVQQREANLGGTAGAVGEWEDLSEPHEGSVPAHTVRGLTTATYYQFRVLARGMPREEESVWSEPSVPFRVGFADFSDVSPSGDVATSADGSDGFTAAELAYFRTLNTPAKVQDHLDTLPMNHETEDDTCLSALEATRQNCGHCIEGAMVGAYILSLHGHPPYLCDMRACSRDDDHNVAVFQLAGRWGCLSVSNHASLRWRNPIYKTLRELMMSFFDDYMNNDGERTLRSYSRPVNLSAVFGPNWATVRGDVFHIA